jgi:hypothetical protein
MIFNDLLDLTTEQLIERINRDFRDEESGMNKLSVLDWQVLTLLELKEIKELLKKLTND